MHDSPSTLAFFRNHTFCSIWIAALASNFGGLVQARWCGVVNDNTVELSKSGSACAGLGGAADLVYTLLAGVFADNFDRRRVMLIAQTFMSVVSVILTVNAFGNGLKACTLLAFTFLIGCGTGLHNPSWQATMGDIVTRQELPSAVSFNSMGCILMRNVGPAAGGAIVALAGAAAAFAVDVAPAAHSFGERFTWLSSD